jgi:hypothetical protein
LTTRSEKYSVSRQVRLKPDVTLQLHSSGDMYPTFLKKLIMNAGSTPKVSSTWQTHLPMVANEQSAVAFFGRSL